MKGQQKVISCDSNNFQLSKKKSMFSNTEVSSHFLKTKCNGIPSKNQNEGLDIVEKCWENTLRSYNAFNS